MSRNRTLCPSELVKSAAAVARLNATTKKARTSQRKTQVMERRSVVQKELDGVSTLRLQAVKVRDQQLQALQLERENAQDALQALQLAAEKSEEQYVEAVAANKSQSLQAKKARALAVSAERKAQIGKFEAEAAAIERRFEELDAEVLAAHSLSSTVFPDHFFTVQGPAQGGA